MKDDEFAVGQLRISPGGQKDVGDPAGVLEREKQMFLGRGRPVASTSGRLSPVLIFGEQSIRCFTSGNSRPFLETGMLRGGLPASSASRGVRLQDSPGPCSPGRSGRSDRIEGRHL